MKGRHKAGDIVVINARVTGVDEGNLHDIKEKDADGVEQVIGCEGDTFVHLDVMGSAVSVYGSKLGDPVKAVAAEEPVAAE